MAKHPIVGQYTNLEEVREAMKTNPWAFVYATDELRDNRELALEAVAINGSTLAQASERLRGDREVVLAAVSQFGGAWQWIAPELKNDLEIALAALNSDRYHWVFFWLPDELRAHPDVRNRFLAIGNSTSIVLSYNK
jgi:hypothetical protein